jgi:hypothetical protein
MLRAVEAGEIDGLLIYHGDRLIRQPFDLEKLIGVADQHRGFRIASPSGTRSLDSPDDRFILRIEAAQACREVDNTSRRVRSTNLELLKQGRRLGGGRYRPFGFGVDTGRTKWVVDRETGEGVEVPALDMEAVRPDEAEIIVEAAERLLAGQRGYGVRRWMDTVCRTTAGNRWSVPSFRSLMLAPRIAGLIEHEGVLYRARWDPIISLETREDLKALFQRNAELFPHPGRDRKYLLSGVAECGNGCAARVQSNSLGTGRRKNSKTGPRRKKPGRGYHCQVCGMRRDMAYTDAWVEGHVLRLLNQPDFVRSLFGTDDRAKAIGADIAKLERRRVALLEQIEGAADDPDVDPVLAMRSLAGYKRRLAELRGKLAASAGMRQVMRLAGATRAQWEAEPVEVRSSVVAVLFRVVIDPVKQKGPGFDPSCVRVERRKLGVDGVEARKPAVAGVEGDGLAAAGAGAGAE